MMCFSVRKNNCANIFANTIWKSASNYYYYYFIISKRACDHKNFCARSKLLYIQQIVAIFLCAVFHFIRAANQALYRKQHTRKCARIRAQMRSINRHAVWSTTQHNNKWTTYNNQWIRSINRFCVCLRADRPWRATLLCNV